MLQYRLSTLFLIFFVVAATMALFGAWGIWVAGVFLLAAICVNRAKRLTNGVLVSGYLVLVLYYLPGMLDGRSVPCWHPRSQSLAHDPRHYRLAVFHRPAFPPSRKKPEETCNHILTPCPPRPPFKSLARILGFRLPGLGGIELR